MEKIRIITLLLIATMSSCSKREVDAEMTVCMREKVAAFKHSERICDDASVTKYLFQNQYVYVFDSACCCDWTAGVFDVDCNTIGALGGIAGNTRINGENFNHAKLIREVWRNPRSTHAD